VQVLGPQALPVGVATAIPDPVQAGGGNASIACQIQNSSPCQLNVIAAGQALSIQPFFAQTVEISGAPMTVTPLPITGTTAANMTFAFLLGVAPGTGLQLADGPWVEDPPQQDGPLTAAAIASALSLQGNVDSVGPAGFVVLNVGFQTFGPFTALHSYSSVVVVLRDIPNGVAFTVQPFLFNTTGAPACPPQTQTTPAGAHPGQLTFFFSLPLAATQQFFIAVTNPTVAAIPNVILQIYAVTATVAVQVNSPLGNPLGTYQVGGNLSVSALVPAAPGGGPVALLAAPPTGFSWRLHRFILQQVAANSQAIIQGVTTAFFYAQGGVDRLDGQLVNEALQAVMLTGAAALCYLYYDVVPVQTIN
jgi:hypothetical protein